MGQLQDAFGRQLQYLRLSVTDRCNFSCTYCLPSGCPRPSGSAPLTVSEIDRLARALAELGIWKVRLTGGEPTIREDIVEIVRRIAATPGIRRVALTTNGSRLQSLASQLRAAGLTSLNVSLDSLDPERFARITGYAGMERIVAGVEAAVAAGTPSVKVNVVLLKGLDDRELDRFLAWTRELPLTVRFIELMQMGDDTTYFLQNHLPGAEIQQKFLERGWAALDRQQGDGPATNYAHPGHKGRVGVIAPYSKGFCDTCNRLRVSATGRLRLCLFGDAEVPLRELLRSDSQKAELMAHISRAVQSKPAAHLLHEGRTGNTTNLASIGG
jgi:cyclic pyranopterin phosphate synthase